MNETTEDRALALIAQGILDASDEEILETARAKGIDTAALQAHVRRLVDARDGKIAAPKHEGGKGPFSVGEAVALRSDPSRVGIVTNVVRTNRETRYGVFIGSRLETLYESQLVVAALAAAAPVLTADDYKARLTALQLTAPSLTNLHSLQAGRIDFIPYQYRPVLKFIHSDRPRLLLADEVGVGKTIEAGLLLRELQARRPAPERAHRLLQNAGRRGEMAARNAAVRRGVYRSRRQNAALLYRPDRSRRRVARPVRPRHRSLLVVQRGNAPRIDHAWAASGQGAARPRRATAIRPAYRRRGAQRSATRTPNSIKGSECSRTTPRPSSSSRRPRSSSELTTCSRC